ncbi:MAG: hypothetical protein NVSMB67_27430 [Flavisolibacter sp.]
MSVETALKRYPAIKHVMVNLVHGIVLVEADMDKMNKEEIAAAVEKLGYSVSNSEVQQYETDEVLFKLIKSRGIIGMVVSIIDLFVDPINLFNIAQQYRAWFSLAGASFVLFWVGFPILRKTIMAVSQRVINANVLLSAGAWGSYIIGILSLVYPVWPNFLPVAAWLMSLHLFFGYFKLDTRKKASDAVRKLLSLLPQRARVKRGTQIVEVPTIEVTVGETLEIKPGERIPLDGVVIEGIASVDESSFTGESVPSTKEISSIVLGGTLNLDGNLKVRVTKIGQDSFLNQIVGLMHKIAEKKPPVELLADKLMNYYGPVVFITAVLSFIGWSLFNGNYTQATLVLLTTIIMGYPCALGFTTPMIAAIAGGKGISIGLLVKASEVFYGLSLVDTIVFDKTGTLTYGKPTVTNVEPIEGSASHLLSIAGAVESKSEHPLGQAISFFAKKENAALVKVDSFRAIPGKGVIATVNGSSVNIGKPTFITSMGIKYSAEISNKIQQFSEEGKTVVVITENERVIGLIALQDTPRKGAEQVIAKFKHRGIKTVMLTGDSNTVASSIGTLLGFDQVKAELLPNEKVKAIEELQQKGAKVAMVGDGINDAPALAQSNVGIAIGAGTDVALESAGVILIGDKLIDVLNALILGKASYRTMTSNVMVAVLFNVVGMVMAAFGLITPLIAITIMIISIFAILINTLRIRSIKLETFQKEPIQKLIEINFKVNNMVCEGCAEKIKTVLSVLPGVKDVKSKVFQKQVAVNYYPGQIKQSELQQVIEKAGFNAVEI